MPDKPDGLFSSQGLTSRSRIAQDPRTERLTLCLANLMVPLIIPSLSSFCHLPSSWLLFSGTSCLRLQLLKKIFRLLLNALLDRLFVPLNLRTRVLQWVHCTPSAGHPGISATLQLVTNRFWWSTLHADVIKFVHQCTTCNIVKASHLRPAGLLQPLPVPQRPWSHIAVDFVTDLPRSQGFTTILSVVDRFSKAYRFIPLAGLPTALQTAEALLHHVFRLYGLPEDIVSDRGSQFTSRVWRALCSQLNINVSLTSGYHPQANGQVERLNQDLTRFLRTYCHRNQQDWSRFLVWAEYAQNSLRKPSTGLTPFQCMLGFRRGGLPGA